MERGLLTRQQRRVLQFAALGLQDRQIAAALDVGTAAVREHFNHAIDRLDARNRTHAVLLTELAPPVRGVRRTGGRDA